MEGYQTESQQVDNIQSLWERYGRTVLAVLVVGFVGIGGMRYMRHHATVEMERASDLYQQILAAVQQQDYQTVKVKGDELLSGYARTPYPQLSALMLAKVAVENKDYDKARSHLQWIMDNKYPRDQIWNIAKVRLARILQAQGDFDGALDKLSGDYNGYTALYEEAKGDLYVEKGDIHNAITAYRNAKNALPEDAKAPWLSMKLMDLGEEEELNA